MEQQLIEQHAFYAFHHLVYRMLSTGRTYLYHMLNYRIELAGIGDGPKGSTPDRACAAFLTDASRSRLRASLTQPVNVVGIILFLPSSYIDYIQSSNVPEVNPATGK